MIALIVFAAHYTLTIARRGFTAIKQGRFKISGFDPEWSDPTYNIVRVLIIAFAIVVSYPYIPGSESPAFKGITIFIGVLFSLGSSSLLANLIAGYTMTYRRAFRVGDRIRIGDLMGDVTEVGLMVTHLRSVKNEELVVPNSVILNSNVVNYSSLGRQRGLILAYYGRYRLRDAMAPGGSDAADGRRSHRGIAARPSAVHPAEIAERLCRDL